MLNFNLTAGNSAIDRLLEVTDNPRHRYILMAYARHRFLEVAGRHDEIFTSDMMADRPVYSMQALGFNARLEGKETVKKLYRMWAETNQCIFYTENEQVAVADNFVASVLTLYQQVWGTSLTISKVLRALPTRLADRVLLKIISRQGVTADRNSMYLYKTHIETIWPYDERGRLVGEHVWEPSGLKPEIIKLDPADVVTTAEAARLLAPLIKPLPSFDEMVLGRKAQPGGH